MRHSGEKKKKNKKRRRSWITTIFYHNTMSNRHQVFDVTCIALWLGQLIFSYIKTNTSD